VTRADLLRDAGAILPGKATKDRSVDTITARAYTHPALDDRVVVRLVPETLGEAEDLSMEFLGFAAQGRPVAVGNGRRRALGFPAWALVNDPANGRHALALVKDMARLARMARSRPGAAKEDYDALATRLGSAAPHFLPTFWEQAGRAYLAAENAKMAGTCFAAARGAEQVHGLVVDEERLREVHLEFALAGALTAKAVTEYSRQVVARRPAGEAYELVRTIATRRVAGGLPPYVGLADDLKRLARTAGLDPAAEAESVLADLLTYPAVARSHEGFWKSYRPALVRLARRDPTVRGRLLAMLPDPPGWNADMTDDWLALLDDAGATDALRAPDKAPPEAAPAGGVVGWVQRLLDFRHRGWRHTSRSPRLLWMLADLVEPIRSELAAQDTVLRLSGRRQHAQPDLDVLDLCLAARVPVVCGDPDNPGSVHIDIGHWAGKPDETMRDLRAVAADPRFLPALVKGLRDYLGARSDHSSHLRRQAMARNPAWRLNPEGLRTAATTWLTDLAESLDAEPTVLTLAEALDSVAPLWAPDGVALAPAVFTGLAEVDVHASLARSLRGGLPAELCWPAYERVRDEFAVHEMSESWPNLVLSDPQHAYAVGPDGVVAEHALRIPSDRSPYTIRTSFVDDQFWVSWGNGGYWSGRPTEIVELRGWRWFGGWDASASLALPDGGRTTGHRPWRVGDTEIPSTTHIASDGVSYGRLEYVRDAPDENSKLRWRQYDPATGQAGPAGRPAFFEEALADGDVAQYRWWVLLPAPESLATSPLGWRDGLVGWRVVRHRDGSYTGTGIDGRTVTWRPTDPAGQTVLAGALRLPGDDRPRPVTFSPTAGHGSAEMTVWDTDGRQPVTRQEIGRRLPPPTFWHALRPRDPRGSEALRAVDAAIAARLLEPCASAASDDLETVAGEAVAAVLADITDTVLAEAVARAVVHAEKVRRVQIELRELLNGDPAAPREAESPIEVSDQALEDALSGLLDRYGLFAHFGPPTTANADQIMAVSAILAGTAAEDEVPLTTPLWHQVLPWPGAVVLRAASALTDDGSRSTLRALLRLLGRLGLAGTDARARVVEVVRADGERIGETVLRSATSVLILGGNRLEYDGSQQVWVGRGLEFSPTGEFDLSADLRLRAATRLAGWGDPVRLAAGADLLERGPAPWRAERVDELVAATGMTRAEAALLLAGLPAIHGWQANFLTTEQRTLLGLKVTEARTARDALRDIPSHLRLALLDAAMPADPADLWSRGPDVAGLARRWTEHFGRTVEIPDALLTEASRMLPVRNAGDVLRTLAAPRPGDWLHTDGRYVDQRTPMVHESGQAFSGTHVETVAVALPWLAYRLPAGDPIRAQLPVCYDLVRQRLRNPELATGYGYHDKSNVPEGLTALTVEPAHGDSVACQVRPARLSGPDDPALAFIDSGTRICLRLLLSDYFANTMAALTTDPTPAGRYPHDPSLSEPGIVEAVMAAHGLPAEAAAYYLQLLALPDPTDKHVLEWNAWRAPTLRAAREALLGTDLVVEAKRERAGRTLFLPGGWLALKAPNLPVEAWKDGFRYGVRGGRPSGRVLVLTPVDNLFRVAWARVTAGDRPRYQSLSEAR